MPSALVAILSLVLVVTAAGHAVETGARLGQTVATVPTVDYLAIEDAETAADGPDLCVCELRGSCSVSSLGPAAGALPAFAGGPRQLRPLQGNIPSGLPPDVPYPPPRLV